MKAGTASVDTASVDRGGGRWEVTQVCGGRELGVQDRLGVQGGSKLPSAGEETFYSCSGFREGSFQGAKNERCAY